MPATNRYMNVSDVAFNSVNIFGVKSLNYDNGISVKKESGNFDQFFTVTVSDFQDPSFTIETIDAMVGSAGSIAPGVIATFTATVRDARNGVTATGGAKIYTMSNASLEDRKQGNSYRQYSTQSLKFGCISSDGATNPVVVTAA